MKCKNCGKNVPDEAIFCPDCGSRDFDYTEPMPVTKKKSSPVKEILVGSFEKFSNLSFRPQSIIVLVLAVAFFFLGFGFRSAIGIKKSDYDSLSQQNSELTANIDTLKQEKSTQEKEYAEYKAKMKPYEEVQLTDAKNKADAEKQRIEKENQVKAEKEAAEKKAAEEKAAEEARQKAAEAAKGYETGITYNQLARTPNDYIGKKVKFKGKVIQVLEGTTETQIRLAVNGDYDSVLYCAVPKSKTENTRILENDRITVMGISMGLLSYKSTMGGTITIPSISVDDWGQN
ncbi:MAG: zinc-ribbon domain-containing protein [Eubacteriales bacterium]|nr:zinc-ribbon domain-containing protein [Eubacteriales bacterium]MDY4213445.1 zinc-ribbon domain-containing protein [Eubacteriales bacterium]